MAAQAEIRGNQAFSVTLRPLAAARQRQGAHLELEVLRGPLVSAAALPAALMAAAAAAAAGTAAAAAREIQAAVGAAMLPVQESAL